MKHRKLYSIIIGMLLIGNLAFAVINNGGTNYTEKLMPVSGSGTVAEYYVVMGTNLSITANATSNRNTTTFTINGDNYMNAGTVSIPASDDDRYYIYHK